MSRAKVLFGCYRRGDANDPEQYVASIAAVLTLYEPALIREVTDPRSGIATDAKFSAFMPNSGELKIYCDTIRDRRYRIEKLAALPRQPMLPRYIDTTTPGRRANLFVRADAPQYADALKWTETADPADWKWDPAGRHGIWVVINWHAKTPMKDGPKPFHWTDEELRKRYPVKPHQTAQAAE